MASIGELAADLSGEERNAFQKVWPLFLCRIGFCAMSEDAPHTPFLLPMGLWQGLCVWRVWLRTACAKHLWEFLSFACGSCFCRDPFQGYCRCGLFLCPSCMLLTPMPWS